jgi:hypothetical protein
MGEGDAGARADVKDEVPLGTTGAAQKVQGEKIIAVGELEPAERR